MERKAWETKVCLLLLHLLVVHMCIFFGYCILNNDSFIFDKLIHSAIMAIDISNDRIGIALAYHRKQAFPIIEESDQQYKSDSTDINNTTSGTTSITALPPIPYMSSLPYHPSYAFLHHHRPEGLNVIRDLDRVNRTMQVADQLAQLAIDRKVKGILVRWPGDLASAVSGVESNVESTTRQVEEDQLLLPNIDTTNRAGGRKSDGSMGYMRGRILYMLDACCTSHGHAQTNNKLSEPLLVEGSRPFALWDTSASEQEWIRYEQENRTHSNQATNMHPQIPRKQDKYGNSLTEMDFWGRAAIFGNQPPQPTQGKFRYASKQIYPGYKVSTRFGFVAEENRPKNQQLHNENNFDTLDENGPRMKQQFQGSLSAMHALYDFVTDNVQGRIILPSWVASASRKARSRPQEVSNDYKDERILAQTGGGSRSGLPDLNASEVVDGNNSNLNVAKASPQMTNKKTNGLANLVQMPKRKARRREKRS